MEIERRNIENAIDMISKMSPEELDKTDSDGGTVLHYAIKCNCNNKNEKIFDLLIEKMTPIGLCNKNMNHEFGGGTVLHIAAKAGLSRICLKLINKIGIDGVKITDSRDSHGVTVLNYAAKSGLSEVCNIVIPMLTKRELEYKDSNRNTALHLAIQSGLDEIAIVLISKISREIIECCNDERYTALQYAAKLGALDVCIELVKQMSQQGIEYKSQEFHYPAYNALAAYEKHVEICKLLAMHMIILAIKSCNYKDTNILEFVNSTTTG